MNHRVFLGGVIALLIAAKPLAIEKMLKKSERKQVRVIHDELVVKDPDKAITITLESNASTGYCWECGDNRGREIAFCREGKEGEPTAQTFEIKLDRGHGGLIRFVYWSPGGEPWIVYVLHIKPGE